MNANYSLINKSFSTLMIFASYSFYSHSLLLVRNKVNNLLPSMMQAIINSGPFIPISSLIATMIIPALYPPILLINSVAFLVLSALTDNQNEIIDIPFLTKYQTKDESILENNFDILENIHIILNQKELNHIVLCGEAGCGKSCLIKVLANELVEEKIPYLKGYEIYKLDAADLASNTCYSGALATKISNMKKFIESKKAKGIKLIIFIDEIHQLSGMGATVSNSNDVWQFLKEGMADSSFTILGTTTDNEYKYLVAQDKALKSRLTKIEFPSLSEERKKEIINFKIEKIKDKFESLRSISQDKINEIIQKAKKNIDPSKEGNSLRNIIKQINFEFSREDLKIQGLLHFP